MNLNDKLCKYLMKHFTKLVYVHKSLELRSDAPTLFIYIKKGHSLPLKQFFPPNLLSLNGLNHVIYFYKYGLFSKYLDKYLHNKNY